MGLDKNKVYEFEGLFSNKFIENIQYKVFDDCAYFPILVTAPPSEKDLSHLPIKDAVQFVSTLIFNTNNKSKIFSEVENLNFKNNIDLLFPLSTVLTELGYSFQLDDLVRVKTNLIPINENNYGHIHMTHIDIKQDNGWTMLYFINSNNGKTHFLKNDSEGKLNIYKSITPKEGKCVFFHSSIYHCGSTQNDEKYRAVINYNYII